MRSTMGTLVHVEAARVTGYTPPACFHYSTYPRRPGMHSHLRTAKILNVGPVPRSCLSGLSAIQTLGFILPSPTLTTLMAKNQEQGRGISEEENKMGYTTHRENRDVE
jgi:hypothetical protein